MPQTEDIAGLTLLTLSADGPPIRTERDGGDLVGTAMSYGAHWVAVPAERFGDAFFDLRTRLAGEIVQKLVNHRIGLAIVGDVSRFAAQSNSLRDFITESNRGKQTWFVPDLSALRERLSR